MSAALTAAFIWVVAGNISAMIPSKDNYWTRAYILMATGVPLLIWLVYQDGLIWGAILLAAAASMLRWPLVYVWRWLRGRGG